jgi:Icc protein
MRFRPKHTSIETKHYQERQRLFEALRHLDRRSFMKVTMAAASAALAQGVQFHAHSFQPVRVAQAQESNGEAFRFAYISDSHLYERDLNPRFIRSLLRAVDDVNQLDPPPDFVLYGGDLAQLGQPKELELGAEILKNLKVPVHMMVGEHDWFLDLGEKWRQLFGEPTYSFDHKDIHFVVLNSILEDDFWTARDMTPMERMMTVAGLDNGIQSRFQVGQEQRAWLRQDLASLSNETPIIVFSHSPLYKYYRPWNFWTEDADEVQALLRRFEHVVVVHGHTHQLLTNRIGNIHFHGMLATAWPWPYAPEGLPELTVQMNRADPFDPNDGCGDGHCQVHPDGLIDKLYNLWNRNPVEVSRTYMVSKGTKDHPAAPNLVSF